MQTNACKVNPCKNRGVCDPVGDEYYNCICVPGFGGPTCEVLLCWHMPPLHSHLIAWQFYRDTICCAAYALGCKWQRGGHSSQAHFSAKRVTILRLSHRHNKLQGWSLYTYHATDSPSPPPPYIGGLMWRPALAFPANCTGSLPPLFRMAPVPVQVNLCLPNPCQNKGVCKGVEGDYSCTCPRQYVGRNCEVWLLLMGICYQACRPQSSTWSTPWTIPFASV